MRTTAADASPYLASQPESARRFGTPATVTAEQSDLASKPNPRPTRHDERPSGRDTGERILLLDRDAGHVRRLTQYLTGHGYRVSAIEDAAELPIRLQLEAPDLILLEQRLGELTGTEVLGRIRAVSSVPVIILAAFSDPVDRIINLEMGADDQVHKSVPDREIMARMRAVLRRMHATPDRIRQAWGISEGRRDVIRPDGTGCGLTTAEFGILRALAMADGEAVSRAELSQRVFGRPLHAGDRAVDTVICKLRQKLGPGVIVTVRPAGYAFAGFPEAVVG